MSAKCENPVCNWPKSKCYLAMERESQARKGKVGQGWTSEAWETYEADLDGVAAELCSDINQIKKSRQVVQPELVDRDE